MSILVFPSCLESALTFVEEARAWDHVVVGASSLEHDPYAARYDVWEKLPFLHEPEFPEKLRELVDRHEVTSLYTPHVPSHLKLTDIVAGIPGLRLRNENPMRAQERRVREAFVLAESDMEMLRRVAISSTPLASVRLDFLASLLEAAVPLFGECPREKMVALCAILADAPKGDVVEIGTLFGKSAFVLNRLADHFGVGPTLAVDPWSAAVSANDKIPTTSIQTEIYGRWDWDAVFKGFLLAMQARAARPFNYIRASSEEGWRRYSSGREIVTPEFGATAMTGRVAVLHIDGNHEEAAVAQDFALWSQALAPGGWIIFDDYVWSWGDGPKKLVTRIREEWKGRIQKDFVLGSAAYLKIGA